MYTDLFSALDCSQAGVASFLMWTLPVLTSSIFLVSASWGQSSIKISREMLALNSKTLQKSLPTFQLLLFTLMTYLLILNYSGLIPFVYGPTSNIWVSMSLALTCWGLLILSGWTKFPTESAAHFAPSGAPSGFLPFLVIIETASIIIRPLTLTIRIIANISAGHIIMGLIATTLAGTSAIGFLMVLGVHIGYNMFEIFVCSIQAYVFSLLVKLYGEEHPSY